MSFFSLHHNPMPGLLLRLWTICLGLSLFLHPSGRLTAGEFPYINGNFQPGTRKNWAPRDWWVNSYGVPIKQMKFDFQYSAPDARGNRTLTVTVPADGKRIDIFGTEKQIVQTVSGDRLTYTGEVRGTGELLAGLYGYKTMWSDVSQLRKVELSEDWKPFKVVFQMRDGSGDGTCYIRSALEFLPGSRISVRNLRLEVEHTDAAALARRGHRYYPVYRLPAPLSMDIEKDLAAWKNIPEGRGFAVHKTNQWQREEFQSSFQMAHDGSNLYLLIRCKEPDTDYIRFTEQAIQKSRNLVEFGITSRREVQGTGHAWYCVYSTGQIKKQDTPQEDEHIRAVIRQEKDCWTVQLRLGMSKLLTAGEQISFGRDYYFNVGRVDTPPEGRRLNSFAPSGFGNPKNFTVMTLFDRGPDKADAGQDQVVNYPYYSSWKDMLRKLAGMKEENWLAKYGKYGTVSGTVLADALKLSGDCRQALRFNMSRWREWRELVIRFQQLEQQLTSAVHRIGMRIDGASLVKRLLVNGSAVPVPADGRVSLSIRQGANILAAELKSGGRVNFSLEGHPETLGRWRRSAAPGNQSWLTADFDDRAWPMVQAREDGSFDAMDGSVRQILFWEQKYYGNYRLTIPEELYGFSRNGYEQMILFLDSPLKFPLQDFTLSWDLPQDLQILNRNLRLYASKTEYPLPGAPERHGYSIRYRNGTAKSNDPNLRKDHLLFKLGSQLPAGSDFIIGYHRSAGNFVELRQELPCRVLPEVNGRTTRNLLWMPGVFSPVPPQSHHAFCEQLYRAGFNAFTYYTVPESFIRSLGGRQATFMYNTCYPMDGAGWEIKGALYDYVKKTPQAQARFFDPDVTWGGPAPKGMPRYMNHRETTRFCLTWACQDGRKDFLRCIREDVATMLRNCPEARIFWNNWERIVGFDKLERCFCPRCLGQFARKLGLPADVKLSREEIRTKYAAEWTVFQYNLDAEVLGMVTEAVQGLGMQFMAYNATRSPGWKAAGGKMLYNPGCPGNGLVTGRNQSMIDDAAEYYRKECGNIRVTAGQMILPNIGWSSGRFDNCVDARGFFQPSLVKNALIRQAAALHGGTRLDASMGGGTLYYMGEATRLVAAYEPLFHRGIRQDNLARSSQIGYPDLLVLTRPLKKSGAGERLVLLFNEKTVPRTVSLENLNLGAGAVVSLWEGKLPAGTSARNLRLTIPPLDVLAIHIVDSGK